MHTTDKGRFDGDGSRCRFKSREQGLRGGGIVPGLVRKPNDGCSDLLVVKRSVRCRDIRLDVGRGLLASPRSCVPNPRVHLINFDRDGVTLYEILCEFDSVGQLWWRDGALS